MNTSERNLGQSTVEFALLIPLALLLILGIIQYAMVLNARQVVSSAAWHGARAAAVGGSLRGWPAYDLVPRLRLTAVSVDTGKPPPDELADLVRELSSRYFSGRDALHVESMLQRSDYVIDGRNLEVRVLEGDPELLNPGDPLTVRVDFRFPLVVPVVDILFDMADSTMDHRIQLSAECTVLREGR